MSVPILVASQTRCVVCCRRDARIPIWPMRWQRLDGTAWDYVVHQSCMDIDDPASRRRVAEIAECALTGRDGLQFVRGGALA